MPRIPGNADRGRGRDNRDGDREGKPRYRDRGGNKRINGDHVNFKAMAILRPESPSPGKLQNSAGDPAPKLLVRTVGTRPPEPAPTPSSPISTPVVPKPLPDTDWLRKPQIAKKSDKIITFAMDVNERFGECLAEQSDFLVVGVVGLEGVGKTTLINFLTQSNAFSSKRKPAGKIFPVKPSKTRGVDGVITAERMIFLDVEPLLSSTALVERVWGAGRSGSNPAGVGAGGPGAKRGGGGGEMATGGVGAAGVGMAAVETALDIQSLQLASLVLAVCHVVVVVQDRVVDPNLVRFLQTAEMLRLQRAILQVEDEENPNGMEETLPKWVGPQGQRWFQPHVVFVHNRCTPEDFTPARLAAMNKNYGILLRSSDLRTHTGFNMTSCFPYLSHGGPETSFNLFLLPEARGDGDSALVKMRMGKFHPGFLEAIGALRTSLWSTPRFPVAEQFVTEKTWLTIVSRTWDAVRRSGNFMEYCRHLHLT